MAEIKQLFQVNSLPGCKRDGTNLDGDQYNDIKWCRFQRGRPKKMGGYQQVTDSLAGPIRDCLVWSREEMNAIFNFSQYGIQAVLVDNSGLGSSIINRTPVGFTPDANYIWSTDTQYDAAVGSSGTVVIAHASKSLTNIDSSTAFKPILGLASGDTAFTTIADAPAVSGGVFSAAPYTFAYGSDGFLSWSDANQPQVWSTSSGNIGDAGAARITGAKIVKGLSVRSGSGPAAILWSLDSVIRMDYMGGQSIFRFSHLTNQSSVLSQNGIVEYDGAYFWPGVDKFMVCDGNKVSELPNQLNQNYFFDNLNFSQRQKVWGMKVPRYGEIWWFFPFGTETECSRAVIFNVRENTWYDVECARSAGYYSQVFHYPVMAGSEASATRVALTLSGVTGAYAVGDQVYGSTSGNAGIISQILGSTYYVTVSSGTTAFTMNEQLVDNTSGATGAIATSIPMYQAFLHEKGWDAVIGDQTLAIESYFETCDFGLPTGGSQANQVSGENRWTRIVRVEPDFIQGGTMSVYVTGRELANSPEVTSLCYNFTNETPKVDMREQRREIRLKFVSNEVGGHYEMGRVIIHTEAGDVRS